MDSSVEINNVLANGVRTVQCDRAEARQGIAIPEGTLPHIGQPKDGSRSLVCAKNAK